MMTAARLLRGCARRLHLSGASESAAGSVLGADHPLARGVSLQRTIAIQLLVTTGAAVLGVVGIVSHGADASFELGAAALVGGALIVSAVYARTVVRERAHEVIASGSDVGALPILVRERRRLASRAERERLAGSLERYLRDAERWFEIAPAYRPPVEVRCLRQVASETREVAARLRADSANVRGVASATRFLTDATASPLFQGDVELLRRELDRLSALLGSRETSWSEHPGRVAA